MSFATSSQPVTHVSAPSRRGVAIARLAASSAPEHLDAWAGVVLRYGLVAVVLFFGAFKFTAAEASGIQAARVAQPAALLALFHRERARRLGRHRLRRDRARRAHRRAPLLPGPLRGRQPRRGGHVRDHAQLPGDHPRRLGAGARLPAAGPERDRRFPPQGPVPPRRRSLERRRGTARRALALAGLRKAVRGDGRASRSWAKGFRPSSTSAAACAFSHAFRTSISSREPAGVRVTKRPRRAGAAADLTQPSCSIRFKSRLRVDFSTSSSRVRSAGRAPSHTAIAAGRLSWAVLTPWGARAAS